MSKKLGLLFVVLLLCITGAAYDTSESKEILLSQQDSVQENTEDISNIVMELSYGYNFYAKYGRHMPVYATITNNQEEFHGWFEASIPLVEDNMLYRKEVNIPSGQSVDLSLVLPLMGGYGEIEVRLLDERNNSVIESTNPIKVGNYEKVVYIGMLTDNLENLTYFKSMRTNVFTLSDDTFPEDYRYLDSLDALVINDYDTSLLNDKQIEALEEWVLNGGTLVIGTGENINKTVPGLTERFYIQNNENDDFVESSITDNIEKDTIEAVKTRILQYEEERKLLRTQIAERNKIFYLYNNPSIYTEAIREEDWLSEKLNQLTIPDVVKSLANVSFSEHAHNVTNEEPLFQKQSLRKGNVLLYAFDLSLREDEKTLGMILLDSILQHFSIYKRDQIELEVNGSFVYSSIQNSMSYTETENIPRVNIYILILVLYILVAGPILYLILRKKDKLSLTWILVPTFALLFTFLIYLVGSKTRVSDPFLGYVEMLTFEDNGMMEEEIYFSLTAPYNNKYSVEIDGIYPVTQLIKRSNEYSESPRHQIKTDPSKHMASITYGAENTQLEINDNPAFSPVYYQSITNGYGENPIKADISYIGGPITGTISNVSDYDLNNVVFICNGHYFAIRVLKAGETIDIEEMEHVFINNQDGIYATDIVQRSARGEPISQAVSDKHVNHVGTGSSNRRSDILFHLIEKDFSDYGNEGYLFGFARESNHNPLIEKLSEKMNAYGTKAISTKINVDYQNEEEVFVPSIQSFLEEGNNNGEIRNYDRYTIAMEVTEVEEEMVFDYYLPKEDKISSVEYYGYGNQEIKSNNLKSFSGNILILNRKTGKFDELLTIDPQTASDQDITLISRKNIGDYLDRDNKLTVFYEPSVQQTEYYVVLPNLSYWKEAK